ncbi:23S rRNA (uracil1939-C5)-methyltransferase [Hathewaya proteolytica DSM 3090]|uniref:23S rRNA (Uracil1939-C5)-methyltransferase n=1 Tax=Hathewaya proteolytica DSM 3090 TaxID=1121331 RepID=A0A1M6LYD5_9CLOT|nr:23S rRNA (uracil(1939)-C(5))-methyltransferase RlmD [Hathewaya proteolytica]SHJ76192.1 23S rRNA (uracil1939-C5)-methyltransferase [Hathewaya proteolytica DSM 3090]
MNSSKKNPNSNRKNSRNTGKYKKSDSEYWSKENKHTKADNKSSSKEPMKAIKPIKPMKNMRTTNPKDINPSNPSKLCKVSHRCGGCQLLDMPYEEQLKMKHDNVSKLLNGLFTVESIIGMESPFNYRNKVHAVFTEDKFNNIISGVYEEGTHKVVPVDSCCIEDKEADEIIVSIRKMMKSFKMKPYNEDTKDGFLRHVLIRKGFHTGEIMVVLVISSIVFPSKKNFIKELLKLHPSITTIVANVNNKKTSMVLGDREEVLYGKGYITDSLCGRTFRISPKSFYQVNPVQTEILYNKAIEFANLTGRETVIDAYCGTGTIGLIAAKTAKQVIGVELNPDAVKDAITNAKINDIKNTRFYNADATEFMMNMASKGETVHVVMMDPPRSGSTEEFINAVAKLSPKTVVYISCNPETLARDLKTFKNKGYKAEKAEAVDMFPMTGHVESIILMTYCGSEGK